MLCDECQQRPATVFLTCCTGTGVFGGGGPTTSEITSQRNLCDECAGSVPLSEYQGKTFYESMGLPSHPSVYEMIAKSYEAVSLLDEREPLFASDAYAFVHQAVQFALIDSAAASTGDSPANVSGRDVAEAFRKLALLKFGTAARATLQAWGIQSCDDIGTIVYRLIAKGQLGARPEDKPEDFHGIYDFDSAFPTMLPPPANE